MISVHRRGGLRSYLGSQTKPEAEPESAERPETGPEMEVEAVGGRGDSEFFGGNRVPGAEAGEAVNLRHAADYV